MKEIGGSRTSLLPPPPPPLSSSVLCNAKTEYKKMYDILFIKFIEISTIK